MIRVTDNAKVIDWGRGLHTCTRAADTRLRLSVKFSVIPRCIRGTVRATISFVMSVRTSASPPVRQSALTEQLGPNWTEFYEIWHLRRFLKIFRENLSLIIIY